mgnify:CR=1 FL=1
MDRVYEARQQAALTGGAVRVDYTSPVHQQQPGSAAAAGTGAWSPLAGGAGAGAGVSSDSARRAGSSTSAPPGRTRGASRGSTGADSEAPASPSGLMASLELPGAAERAAAAAAEAAAGISSILNPVSRAITDAAVAAVAARREPPAAVAALSVLGFAAEPLASPAGAARSSGRQGLPQLGGGAAVAPLPASGVSPAAISKYLFAVRTTNRFGAADAAAAGGGGGGAGGAGS